MTSQFLRWLFLSSLIFCTSAHNIVKREAAEGKFYVYSSLQGCFPVKSREPCPVNWNLPPFFAKSYEGQNEIVSGTLQLMANGIKFDEMCEEAAKSALCSQVTPRCSENTSEDYGNTTALCENVRERCPREIAREVCDDLLMGKYPKNKCVTPLKTIDGICPQPKYKMPTNELHDYRRVSREFSGLFNSLEELPGDQHLFSKECLSRMKGILCILLACSADEKRLLVKSDELDCYDVVNNCFPNTTMFPSLQLMTDNLKELLEAHCKMYPKRTVTETEDAPPTIKPLPSVATCNLPHLFLFFCALHILILM